MVYTCTYIYILCMYMVYTLFIDVCTCLHLYFELFCVQDTILVIPPYPYCIEEVPQDVPLEDCWYAWPLCPSFSLPASSVHRGETSKESILQMLP